MGFLRISILAAKFLGTQVILHQYAADLPLLNSYVGWALVR